LAFSETLYEALLGAAWPVLRLAMPFDEKVAQGIRGREATWLRMSEWAWIHRAPDTPLVWIHAPSVGEGLMAQAIITELRRRRPDVQIAFTHFSPSAERMVAEVGADIWGFAPWDTRGSVRPVLEALRPSAIVFVRTEVWPVLAREAAAAGVPLLLVNAVLSEGSGRMKPLARWFMAPAFRRLARVGAVTGPHGDRFRRLGVPEDRIRVTGDARFDQVWNRIEARGLYGLRSVPDAAEQVPEALRPIWRLLDDPDVFTVVAGSTWAEDEAVLLSPFTVLRRDRAIRLLIAPHDPTPAHLNELERRLDGLSLRHARLGAFLTAGVAGRFKGAGGTAAVSAPPGRTPPEVVVVDRMGVLADLYGMADAAYVGGGFGQAGLHSVVEPATLGVPVLFGPAFGNSREAGELAAHGGGFVVTSAADVEARLHHLSDNRAAAAEVGARAREYVRSETGSAVRNAELILDCLGSAAEAPSRGPWVR
jgi:3-deoxy-D-manno-octulosonic-acid transferase